MLVNLQIPCKDPAPYFIDHFAFSKEITLTAVTIYLKYILGVFFNLEVINKRCLSWFF